MVLRCCWNDLGIKSNLLEPPKKQYVCPYMSFEIHTFRIGKFSRYWLLILKLFLQCSKIHIQNNNKKILWKTFGLENRIQIITYVTFELLCKKAHYPLNLVLEKWEYLALWTFRAATSDGGLKVNKCSIHTLVILQNTLNHCLKFRLCLSFRILQNDFGLIFNFKKL